MFLLKQMLYQKLSTSAESEAPLQMPGIKMPGYEVMYNTSEIDQQNAAPMPKVQDFLKHAVHQIIDNCKRNNITQSNQSRNKKSIQA
jgi:hypothetical protein